MENKRAASRIKRQQRVRKKVKGTPERPRLSVFRSAKHIYAQIIDDTTGHTLVSCASTEEAFKTLGHPESKCNAAETIGKMIGARAKEKGIEKVVFDRNGFLYHGRIKSVSDGAREAGLQF